MTLDALPGTCPRLHVTHTFRALTTNAYDAWKPYNKDESGMQVSGSHMMNTSLIYLLSAIKIYSLAQFIVQCLENIRDYWCHDDRVLAFLA